MITTQEIAIRVYQLLKEKLPKDAISGDIGYSRIDYTGEDIIIIPHDIVGLASRRFGAIKVNIHVPDINIPTKKNPTYIKNDKRLKDILEQVIQVLKEHYEVSKGYNWIIDSISPAIKEQGHNEHFISLHLSITVREK